MADRGTGPEPLTSLFGRTIQLFPSVVRLKDLFTEAVARLFEWRFGAYWGKVALIERRLLLR